MRILLFILIASNFCFSQKAEENCITYYNFANEGEFFLYENKYDSAVLYFGQAFEFASEPAPHHIEKYNRALWKIADRKKALSELEKNYHYNNVDNYYKKNKQYYTTTIMYAHNSK